ncbi:Conserved DNA-binding protein YbaB [Nonomuraea solani]|uniref:Conserved DNA-binding protein YbaB n=1 Tax=Nonomuraea solani TaxID=1144553 RepID=A0A1H6ELP2_9ACTN|nr:YbaB/EbfC family nucleoid-associated protein [Nonomuraea solani]SEG98233.1 Conserved DNA-binding protein YbaB [Nonomuraea solani]
MRPPTPDNDAEFLLEYAAQGQRVIRDLQAAQSAIRQLEGVARSKDGLLEAAADGEGGLTRLLIDPRALRLREPALGREVAAVLRAAQEEAARMAQEIADAAEGATAMPQPLDETFVRERVEQAARDLLH